MHDAVVVLDQATSDLHRLSRVVHSRRVRPPLALSLPPRPPPLAVLTHPVLLARAQNYDLVTEPDVWSAQRALANEMSPQIGDLIGRAEVGLEGLKARERELRAKVRRWVSLDVLLCLPRCRTS